jgi:putative ABC transport system ATP-binding protein
MIELRHVTKIYRMGEQDVPALAGVDFHLTRGEFVTVMGPSGSGKSTLLHILGCLDVPTSGQYLLEGTDITTLSDRKLAAVRNRHFGFVFQSFNLFPEMTAWENVAMPLMYAGVPPKERQAKAMELLAAVEMEHRLHHFPAQMSGGEQQRVAIARALANDPTLLLADEPTGNLPSQQGEEVLSIFSRLNDDGMTIVLVTHDPVIGRRGQRLIRLCDGRIADDQPLRNVTG